MNLSYVSDLPSADSNLNHWFKVTESARIWIGDTILNRRTYVRHFQDTSNLLNSVPMDHKNKRHEAMFYILNNEKRFKKLKKNKHENNQKNLKIYFPWNLIIIQKKLFFQKILNSAIKNVYKYCLTLRGHKPVSIFIKNSKSFSNFFF